jgi:hypothetical protein
VGAGAGAGVEIGAGGGVTRVTGRSLWAANQIAPVPVVKATANAASANRLILGKLSLGEIPGSSVFEELVSSRGGLVHRLISGGMARFWMKCSARSRAFTTFASEFRRECKKNLSPVEFQLSHGGYSNK